MDRGRSGPASKIDSLLCRVRRTPAMKAAPTVSMRDPSTHASADEHERPVRSGTQVRLKLLLGVLLWLGIVACSLGWNLHQAQQYREGLALEAARAFFDLLVLVRHWNAEHGGLYVPVTEQTQPNPYLEVPRRDIRLDDGLTLTKVNPAYMTRQLAELAAEGTGVQFHITSLKPIRPANAPQPWEAEALRTFETGTKEIGEVFGAGGRQGYRYMAPLFTEKPCLKCHADQGYRLGDVRGGISITLPSLAPLPIAALVVSHLAIALAGVAVILIMGWMLGRAYESMRHQAIFDVLTNIPNRRFFIHQLMHEVRRGRRERMPLSLLICDLDYFKGYNDTFGHQAGDSCLRSVAELLRGSLRRGGDFCARYGGEEFVMVLPKTGLSGGLAIAESIRANLAERRMPHPASPLGIVTISIGVAAYAADAVEIADERDHEALIRRADEALYRAKECGRNRVEADGDASPTITTRRKKQVQ